MLMISGELRKILPSNYVNRQTGEEVNQLVLVIEPSNRRQNYEIFLNSKQIQGGAIPAWQALKGNIVTVEVDLYVNYQHNFHKFSAVGNGMPIKEKP